MSTSPKRFVASRSAIFVGLMFLLFGVGSVTVATVVGAIGLTVLFAWTVSDTMRAHPANR